MTVTISKKTISSLIFNYVAIISMIIALSMIIATGLSTNFSINLLNPNITLGFWTSTVNDETGLSAFKLNAIGITTLCFVIIAIIFSTVAFIFNCQLKKTMSVSNILLAITVLLFLAISITMFVLKPTTNGDDGNDNAIWHTDDNGTLSLNSKGITCLAFACISLITTVAFAAVYTITLKTKKTNK
ncbi:MAG: hypothetical protein LBV48_01210 [Mycoplasmataceae bacterium]|nr:hypothetical protein [Mycoplasmataceae bacterium]